MTSWQFDLLIGGELLLLAATSVLGVGRLQARGYAPISRSMPHLILLASAFVFCGALVSWWSDFASAERAQQHGDSWHPFLLPTILVNGAFLVLALFLVFFLVEVFLFVRRRRRALAAATAAE